ncbi:MAG: OmpA family protein [Pseudomonadota bacterium]
MTERSSSLHFKRLVAAGLIVSLTACGVSEDVARTSRASSNCVPLPDGEYLFSGGKFQPVARRGTNASDAGISSTANGNLETLSAENSQGDAAAPDWLSSLPTRFQDLGYGWMGVAVRGRSAVITGNAPSESVKTVALAAARTTILDDPAIAEGVSIVVDAVSIEGGAPGYGAALLDLDEEPSREECQSAFERVIEGRPIEFRTGSAVLQSESEPLIDAVAGVAIICDAYGIEIGSHTGDIGEDLQNLSLSQRRAEAVQSQMIDRGVGGEMLTAVGYGETRPLDESGTRAARARNRRLEFRVSHRPG